MGRPDGKERPDILHLDHACLDPGKDVGQDSAWSRCRSSLGILTVSVRYSMVQLALASISVRDRFLRGRSQPWSVTACPEVRGIFVHPLAAMTAFQRHWPQIRHCRVGLQYAGTNQTL